METTDSALADQSPLVQHRQELLSQRGPLIDGPVSVKVVLIDQALSGRAPSSEVGCWGWGVRVQRLQREGEKEGRGGGEREKM